MRFYACIIVEAIGRDGAMILLAFLVICFFPSPFLAHPLTSEQALQAVLGTSDPDELKRIARNPSDYWEERKKHLLKEGTLKPHRRVLEDFLQETKQRCQDLLKQTKEILWYRNLTSVDKILSALLPADDPRSLFTKAYAYSMLCDDLLKAFPYHCHNKENFRKMVQGYFARREEDIYEQFDHKMFWLLNSSGLFSMWDCLVMLGENLVLGGMQKNVMDRDSFSTHYGAVTNHVGALTHDAMHASGIINMFRFFAKHGISCGNYIQDCLKEKTTSNENVVELCQKVLAGFFKFHEEPPLPLTIIPPLDDTPPLEELLFPKKITVLSDIGMREVTRFFLDTQADISQGPLAPQELSSKDALKHFDTWSDLYFSQVSHRYLQSFKKDPPKTYWQAFLNFMKRHLLPN